jgi:hypothetical protein
VHELGGDQVGERVVHHRAQDHDPVLQQPRVQVERPLSTGRLLDHDGDHLAAHPASI